MRVNAFGSLQNSWFAQWGNPGQVKGLKSKHLKSDGAVTHGWRALVLTQRSMETGYSGFGEESRSAAVGSHTRAATPCPVPLSKGAATDFSS